MAVKLLKLGLYALGVIAMCVALSMIFFGPHKTGYGAATALSWVSNIDPHVPGLDNVNVDSEMRFYSVFWFVYGLALIMAARDFATRRKYIPILLALFFAGGVVRLLSMVSYGLPHPLFLVLMSFELCLPIVLGGLWLVTKPR